MRMEKRFESEEILRLNEMIRDSGSIVFFGGAGVSTESGIPDFRSADGLYNDRTNPYRVSPEEILSRTYFDRHTREFYTFYREKMLYLDAEPNSAHKKLAELEQAGKRVTVVTQNIDGLHQKAGSRNVLELHGSVHRNKCMNCGQQYNVNYVANKADPIPECTVCGGVVKPDVVLYEEHLDERVIEETVKAISSCDMLIVAGTSLTVYPAAGFVRYFRGRFSAVINLSEQKINTGANLMINGKVGEVLSKVDVDFCMDK